MKKILFKTFGNSLFGLGHVLRSISLAKYIQKNFELEIFFGFHNFEDLEYLNLIRKNNFETKCVEDCTPTSNSAYFLLYDMPIYDADFFKFINKWKFINRVGLDFFHEVDDSIDIAINLFNHQNLSNRKYISYDSINYAIIREEIENCKPIPIESLSKVVITFGSLDPMNNSVKALQILKNYDLKEIDIVVGPLNKFYKEIKKTSEQITKSSVNIIKSPSNFGEILSSADIVFCGGGTTLLESIYLSRPAIVIPQTIEEKNFANFLSQENLCITSENDDSNLNLLNLYSSNKIMEIHRACLQAGIKNGKKLITKTLLGLTK